MIRVKADVLRIKFPNEDLRLDWEDSVVSFHKKEFEWLTKGFIPATRKLEKHNAKRN